MPLDTSDLQYEPKVQTYIKNNSSTVGATAIANPPEPGFGIRYALAQGPSMVPGAASEDIYQYVTEFNLNTMELAVVQAAAYGAQMITFPELHMSGYEFGDTDGGANVLPVTMCHGIADYLDTNGYPDEAGPISQLAAAHNIAIICTMPLHTDDPQANNGYFDGAVVFDSSGINLGTQFKTHLWGFDEKQWFSIPEFPATTAAVVQGSGIDHNPNYPYAPFYINGVPVGIGICYDAEFPEVSRCLALNGSLLTVFPTAAPDSILSGQTEPYPDISEHYIPANALVNLNFCSYSNRGGDEYSVTSASYDNGQWTIEADAGLTYSGNSVLCSPYGKRMVAPVTNEHALLIADCIPGDYPSTQPADTNYLNMRRPELCGYLTNTIVSYPFGFYHTYE